MHFTCTYHYPYISIIFHSISYILQYSTTFFPLTKYNTHHWYFIYQYISFQYLSRKKEKKSTFPIQLHPLYLFLTFFSKPIYINNRRNCFKNRFNFHRKLIPSVILTLSHQPLRANQSSRWKMAAKQGNSFETSRGIYLFIVYSSTARGRFLFRSVILEDFGPARGSTCTGWKRAKLFLFAL